MRKYLIIYVSIIFFQLSAQAQLKSEYHQKFTEGSLLILEGNYVQALKNFTAAYNIDSSNANINFKVGYCYLKTINERSLALPYLERAVVSTTKKYNDLEPSEKMAPINAFYYYGLALHLNYKFDEAIANFEKFKSFLSDRQADLLDEVNRQIEISNNAKALVSAPIKVDITNLGDSINTPYPEYSPVISADENTLIFTSRRPGSTGGDKTIEDQFYEDIYIAYRKPDNTWTEPKSISPNINTYTHEASVGLTADAHTLLIYKDINGGDIYYSSFDNNQWSVPKPMESDINTPSWETSACLTPDGNTLYFVSNRKGGLGGRDIWKCVKLPNGKWSRAVNVGAPINTKYDEESPFIHPSGNLLFFSSNGHNTIGGFDIFFSTFEDNRWLDPLNIGYPINTTDDDLFYVTSPDGKRGYYSSASRPEGYGEKDIYMISIPERKEEPLVLIKGFIVGKTGESLPTNLLITATNNTTGELVGTYHPRESDGSFAVIIPPGSNYTIAYLNDGKEFYSESLDIPRNAAYQEIKREVSLNEVNIETAKNDSIIAVVADATKAFDQFKDKSDKPAGEVSDSIVATAATPKNNSNNSTDKTSDASLAKNAVNFEYFFDYNATEVDIESSDFKALVESIVALYKKNGVVNLTITSSASSVPTRAHASNKKLAAMRNDKLKGQLLKTLKKQAIPVDKIILSKIKITVGGPAYKNDFIKNKATYKKYQYVKVSAS